MIEAAKTLFTSFAVKVAFAMHFILEFFEEILHQPIPDLLQNITSVLSIVFIILKSVETYKNIQTQKNNANNQGK